MLAGSVITFQFQRHFSQTKRMGKSKAYAGTRKSRNFSAFLQEEDFSLRKLLPNFLHKPSKSTVSFHVYLYLQWLKVGVVVMGGRHETEEEEKEDLFGVMNEGRESSRDEQRSSRQQHTSHTNCLHQVYPGNEVNEQVGKVRTSATQPPGSMSGYRQAIKKFKWKPVILATRRKLSPNSPGTSRQWIQRPRAYKLHQGSNSKFSHLTEPQPQTLAMRKVVVSGPQGTQNLMEKVNGTVVQLKLDDGITSHSSVFDTYTSEPIQTVIPHINSDKGLAKTETVTSISQFKRLHDMYSETSNICQVKRLGGAIGSSSLCTVIDPMWCQNVPVSPQNSVLKEKICEANTTILTNISQDIDAQLDEKNIMISESKSPLHDVLQMKMFSTPPGKSIHLSCGHSLLNPTCVVDSLDELSPNELPPPGLISPWNTRNHIPWSPSHFFVRAKVTASKQPAINVERYKFRLRTLRLTE